VLFSIILAVPKCFDTAPTIFPYITHNSESRKTDLHEIRRGSVSEVTGEWRKLHNEELRDLYSSSSIIRIIKSRRMRWAGHVARMGRRGTRIGYWSERQRERLTRKTKM
jgi:hypothetical protein